MNLKDLRGRLGEHHAIEGDTVLRISGEDVKFYFGRAERRSTGIEINGNATKKMSKAAKPATMLLR